MAFNPINFMQAPILRDDRVGSFADSLMQGLTTGFNARQKYLEGERAQQEFDMKQALIKKQQEMEGAALNDPNSPQNITKRNTILIETLKNDPIARKQYYEKMGFSPEEQKIHTRSLYGMEAETPEEKRNFELKKIDLTDAREERRLKSQEDREARRLDKQSKKEDKDGLSIESSVKSDMQKRVATIDRLLPLITKLRYINAPLKGTGVLNMKAKREYDSTLAEAAEAFMKAKDLPSTNESLKMVKEEIFAKRYGESNDDYKERIASVISSLGNIRSYTIDALKANKIPEQNQSSIDKNTLSELPKGSVVVEFVQGPNGKWGRK